jgi:hypothetical protein
VPPVEPEVEFVPVPEPELLLLAPLVEAPVLPAIEPLPPVPVEFVMLPVAPVPLLLLGDVLPCRLLLVPAAPAPELFRLLLVPFVALPLSVLLPVPLRFVLLLVEPLTLPPPVLGLLAAPPLTVAPVRFVEPILTLVLPGVIVELPSVMSLEYVPDGAQVFTIKDG